MAQSGWGIFQKRRRPLGRAALTLTADQLALVFRAEARREPVALERKGASLAEAVAVAGAAGMACEWVLEPSQYSLLQVDRPAVPPEEWVQALRWKVRDLIPYPVDDAVMDAFEVPGLEARGRPPTLYLAVAQKSQLQPRIEEIGAAGLLLSRIGIAHLAWAAAARQLAPGDESQAVLVIEPRGGSMLAMQEGILFVARQFEFDADDQRALRDPEAGRRERLFERIALELQRTLDYFDRTHQRPSPRRLLLLCGIEGLDGLGAALRGLLGLEVQEGAPEQAWAELAGLPLAARARLAGLSALVAEAAP